MFKNKAILVIGDCTIVSKQLTKVRGYGEAIEALKKNDFNIVITDAKLPGAHSGRDVLSFIREYVEPKPQVTICHSDISYQPVGGRRWWIEPSLVHFVFAQFYQGTVDDYIRRADTFAKKCA